MDVEDHVAVIGHHALTVFRTTAQFHQLARHCTTCHRDNFYWQREFAQNINLLGSVSNTDKFFRNRSNDFFTGQRRAAAFDHLHVAVDFICAINVDAKAVDFVEIKNVNAEAFQFFSGSI
ncbi:Uncharacterised protein [Shigella sonnei]|nr:Uncharacterised protein [Shigella sonnei]